MRLVRDVTRACPESPSSVTVGVFDGVHRGHQKIITGMVAEAHAAERVAVAYTFDPHPAAAMGLPAPLLLTTLEERADMLATLGLDILVVPPFTRVTARTKASDFVNLLIRHLRLAELWAGPDFGVGHHREGDISFVTRLGEDRGFTVRVVEAVECQGNWVSSSRIRQALAGGDLDWANECLGRPYRLTGRFDPVGDRTQPGGRCTGRLSVAAPRLIPSAGTYACRGHTGELRDRPCVAYVDDAGRGASGHSAIGVHLLGAEGEVRAEEMVLDFIARLDDVKRRERNAERSALLEDARWATAVLGDLS